MNQAVARRSASGAIAIPPHLAIPDMPAAVVAYERHISGHAEQLARWKAARPEDREDIFVAAPPSVPALRPDERAEAERAASALDREMAPIDIAAFRAWLGVVNGAVRNPQSQEDFAVRCLGLHALLDDLPNGCFTAEARRALPAFFPSAADIRTAVEPGAFRLRRAQAALTKALETSPTEAEAPYVKSVPTTDEIAAVRAKLAAFREEVAASRVVAGAGRDTSRPIARFLRDEEMLLALRHAVAAANDGSRGPLQFRLDVLERRMAGEREAMKA